MQYNHNIYLWLQPLVLPRHLYVLPEGFTRLNCNVFDIEVKAEMTFLHNSQTIDVPTENNSFPK